MDIDLLAYPPGFGGIISPSSILTYTEAINTPVVIINNKFVVYILKRVINEEIIGVYDSYARLALDLVTLDNLYDGITFPLEYDVGICKDFVVISTFINTSTPNNLNRVIMYLKCIGLKKYEEILTTTSDIDIYDGDGGDSDIIEIIPTPE